MFRTNTQTSEYISVVVTHECNRNCPFCVDAYRGRKEFISRENVWKAVSEADRLKVRDVLLVGGEPTLHPDIVWIAKQFHDNGFHVILTTNYSVPPVVKALDEFVDSINVSWYGQKTLPNQKDFSADITLSALVFKGQLDSKGKIDEFIDEHRPMQMKFSTLTACNDFCKRVQSVPYLDELEGRRFILFDEILGQMYRNYIIKRYDRLLRPDARQSIKFHVDGTVNDHWDEK